MLWLRRMNLVEIIERTGLRGPMTYIGKVCSMALNL